MIDGDIEPVIYVAVRASRVSMSTVVLMLFGRMSRIFMYRPDKTRQGGEMQVEKDLSPVSRRLYIIPCV